MRRPVLCGGADHSGASAPVQMQSEGTLSRVRRLLSSSLPGRRGGRTFGVRLEELVARQDTTGGVPHVVVRLCTYIENHGLEHEGVFRTSGNQKVVEKLRGQFDRSGDAELETCGDVNAAAALLKLFLRELPEPCVTETACSDMLHALGIPARGDCIPEVRKAMAMMPEVNQNLVRYIASFLRRVARKEPQNRMNATALGVVFGPSLFRQRSLAQQSACNTLAAKMVVDFHDIFPEAANTANATVTSGSMHGEVQSEQQVPVTSESAQVPHRKRKERHESAGSSQLAQDRKVIRSNSQERQSDSAQDTDNNETHKSAPSVHTLADTCVTEASPLPLHEHNCAMEEEESEHERRRSSERFASFPRSSTPRTGGGTRRYHQPRRSRRALETKENSNELHHHHHHHHHRHAEEVTENTSHAFLQLHPQEECESRERSPSPATPRAVPPLLDLSTLHQQVDCAEPLPSQAPHHRVPEESHVLLSPRNSMILTRRLDPNVAPSPPVEHARRGEENNSESRVKQLTKHVNSVKKKIKIYEEQFETENGYRLSHADKLGNRELKKLFSELNKLRKELKQVKEDVISANNAKQALSSQLNSSTQLLIEDAAVTCESQDADLSHTLHDLEQRLQDKRDDAGRPAGLEDMSRDQLLAEKVALQKALLSLENKHGRPVTRGDRDLVRPLYDRYRNLKRLVVRSGGSKLRDSMSELATILEHETMDFTATPESTASESAALPADVTTVAAELPTESSALNQELGENLHSLPLCELLARQQEAREEKKRLRRTLREFEEEFQRGTGRRLQREDREPRQQEYASYKQAKAKLRLLEALVAKHGQGPRSC